MPNVAELIRDHVTLTVDCVDRLYLNAYVPRLQTAGGVFTFLRRLGPIVSPALFHPISDGFRTALHAFAQTHDLPWIEFRRGERKDDVVEPYRKRFKGAEGVVLIGVAQERAQAWRGVKQETDGGIRFDFRRASVFVNHYYIYFIDPEWGPGFLKVCGYAPYTMKLCLNGHEWAKRQLARQGLPFTALDNGFLRCADPARLQAICDRLDASDIDACLRRWLSRLPLPLTAADADAGFGYRLSILQMEVSRTQVFDRPRHGRELFEEVIRDNLSLGRPSEVQLLFQRRITRRTPGRFQTRVVTSGVLPSLHIDYKRCRVKQYFKEGRALRTETTINDAYDFGVGRWLANFAALQAIGRQLNTRLLEQERVAHDCGMARAELADLLAPGRTPEGQPAPGLRFGQPRVTALLQALCLFALTPSGITNGRLRPLVAQLLGLGPEEYTARQMGYDLRRIARKGLIRRLDHRLSYQLTTEGRRIALFLTTLQARVLRPGLQALDTRIISTTPPPLRTAFLRLEGQIDTLTRQAHLAA